MVDQIERPALNDPAQAMLLPAPGASFPNLWFSGRLVPWEAASVHVSLVGWPAVNAVFEGIRGYWNERQGALHVFRLPEHIARLERSMKLMRMVPRFSREQLTDAVLELCRANAAREDIYIQPLAFIANSRSGSGPQAAAAPEVVITMRPSASALLSGAVLRAGVSSWTRISDDVLPPRIKALPNYANSRLASNEAQRHGYDAPVFLNRQGKVAESSGSCIVIVRDGVAITPPVTESILESITRASLLELLAVALGVPVQEQVLDRTELYTADEILLCGTSMEVAAVTEVDGYVIGAGMAGPVTTRLERLFHDIVRGDDAGRTDWLTTV